MPTIQQAAIRRFADAIKALPPVKPLDFHSTFDGKGHDAAMYPEIGHPYVMDFFYLACLHQYGFWHGDRMGYRGPMFTTFRQQQIKGSDGLWMALKRALDQEPELFTPKRLSSLTEHEMWERLFVDGDGKPIPFSDPSERLELTRTYGRYLANAESVSRSAIAPKDGDAPLAEFLFAMNDVPGYRGDGHMKKAKLLAMVLKNRPERFLKPADGEELGPIIDYHLMRVSLRIGLVTLDDSDIQANQLRRWVSKETEAGIRDAVSIALTDVQRLSGASSDALDLALWNARRYCPEMSEPNCAKCSFAAACDKNTSLFQPVYRTTAY